MSSELEASFDFVDVEKELGKTEAASPEVPLRDSTTSGNASPASSAPSRAAKSAGAKEEKDAAVNIETPPSPDKPVPPTGSVDVRHTEAQQVGAPAPAARVPKALSDALDNSMATITASTIGVVLLLVLFVYSVITIITDSRGSSALCILYFAFLTVLVIRSHSRATRADADKAVHQHRLCSQQPSNGTPSPPVYSEDTVRLWRSWNSTAEVEFLVVLLVAIISGLSCLAILADPATQGTCPAPTVNIQPVAAPVTTLPSTLSHPPGVISPDITTPPSSIQDRLSALESAMHNMTKTLTVATKKEPIHALLEGGVNLFKEWSARVVRRFAATACQASMPQAGSTEALQGQAQDPASA